jgi:hypothetical protein
MTSAPALAANHPIGQLHRRELVGDKAGEQARVSLGQEPVELSALGGGQIARATTTRHEQLEHPTALVWREACHVIVRQEDDLTEHEQLCHWEPSQAGDLSRRALDEFASHRMLEFRAGRLSGR